MTDERSQVYRDAKGFLDDHADGEAVLEAVLAADERHDTWAFEDVDLDSGIFGEVVSTNVIERVDGEYRVADPEAVRAALSGEELTVNEDGESGFEFDFDVNYGKVGGLFGALLVVVLARTFHFRSVFVEGRVVSPGNDPYFFRYWQEELAAQTSGPFDFGVLVNPPWDDGSFNQRPLTHATNWWFTELLGGGQWAADTVAAWLPLVFTVLLALVIYKLAMVLTRDYRVGLVSVLVLALAPVHANYTGLGLLHHRYNQYLWFGLILLTLAWLGTDITRRRERVGAAEAVSGHLSSRKTWAVALAFGLALAAWTHSWGGSLELFAALGAFVGVRVCMDVRDEISPGRVNLPLAFGFGIGAGLAMLAHLALGWHGLPAPALAVVTFLGVVSVVGLGEFWHRQGWSAKRLLLVQPVIAVVGVFAVIVSIGALFEVVELVIRNIAPNSAPEWQVSTQSQSLYSLDLFFIFGPIAQIGLTFYIGLAALGWCLFYVYREYDPAWLLVGVVTAHYLVVSGIQVRFAGRLVIVMAVLAGLGVVYLFSALELVSEPLPIRRSEQSDPDIVPTSTVGSLDFTRSGLILGVGALVFGVSLIFVPTLMGQVTNEQVHTETAVEISEHADSLDRNYPENHVLAPWSEYRLYNYFVSGESESETLGRYGYRPLFLEENIDDRLTRYTDRIGYLVLSDGAIDVPAEHRQKRLTDQLGLSDDRFESLQHYRLISLNDDADIAVFAVVSGAQIEVDSVEGSVSVETNVTVAQRTFRYSQEHTVSENGTLTVTVPYPGTYDVGETTVSVSETDVLDGRTVRP